MSLKRQATTELNHDNWDQEEPAESNEMGTFKTASKDVLEKRVIRTAKRRAPISSSEANKSIFGNTKLGDNKPIPSSFDFLANLTKQNTNGSTGDTSVSSSLIGFKPSSPSGGLFSASAPLAASKPSIETPLSTSSFSASEKISSSMFAASKADTKVNESPFKIQNPSSTAASATPSITSNIFGVSSTSNLTPFKLQTESSTTTFGTTKSLSPITEKKDDIADKDDTPAKDKDETNDKKMSYYIKLKALNECVSAWISKHVEKTPLCILTPIFKDYEKHLKEIMEEDKDVFKVAENKDQGTEMKNSTLFGTNTQQQPPFGGASNSSIKSTSNDSTSDQQKFSFGIVTSPNNKSDTTTTNTGFSFGVVTSSAASSTSSPFSSNTSTPTSTPFSFGINKAFSFSPNNVPQNTEPSKETTEDTEEEPPKVEYTPVKEDNCVFDVTCKVFVKKDGNFVDKGVGTLYIKEIKETKKHQLLVRANTNLGTILLNLVLSSAVPMQRAGKNNVMLVCIPTPDAKPPPTPILIRVKTAEGADDLLETLKKFTS